MNSTLLKRLFRAIRAGSGPDVEVLCRTVVEDEKRAGHARVAEELERILDQIWKSVVPSTAPRCEASST